MNSGGPAFPSLHYKAVECGQEGRDYASFEGMTLRDYLAANAMQAMINFYLTKDEIAKESYAMADAMLKAKEAQ